MKYIKNLRIDIDKKNFEVIPSVQYDSNTRFLHIYLLNNSMAFNITGCSVKISVTKPDGTAIFNNCNIINAKEGFIEVELTEQINAMSGIVKCELKLYDGNGVLTTKQFKIEVSASITSKEITSSNEFKALTDAVNEIQNIDNRFKEVDSQIKENEKSFNEQFNTIQIQKLDKNGILSMANMGQDVKEAMTGGSVAVVDRDTVLTENIVDNQVTPKKTSFLEMYDIGENIFDSTQKIINGKVLGEDGISLTVNASYDTTANFIDVSKFANKKLYGLSSQPNFRTVVQYDSNYSKIKSELYVNPTAGFLVDAQAKYIKFSIQTGVADTIMLTVDKIPTIYAPYSPKYTLSKNVIIDSAFEEINTNNIFDYTKKLDSGILNLDGTISANANYNTTDFIACDPNTQYNISYVKDDNNIIFAGYRSYIFYDKNKQIINGYSSSDMPYIIKTPINCYYMKVSIYNKYSTGGLSKVMITKGAIKPTKYNTSIKKNKFNPAYKEFEDLLINNLYGKTVIGVGDSITQSDGANAGWLFRVADKLGMKAVNYGINGSTIASKQGLYDGVLNDMSELNSIGVTSKKYYLLSDNKIYEYVTNAWASTSTQSRTPIIDRYTAMSNDADIVIVLGGSNDWSYAWTPIGNMNDRTNNTFYGGIHNLILGLMDKYKGKQLVFMTPIKRYENPIQTNNNGLTLKQYCDILKEVCQFYGVPVIDLFSNCNLCPFIQYHADNYFLIDSNTGLSDRTHPNDVGYEIMAKYIASQLISICNMTK